MKVRVESYGRGQPDMDLATYLTPTSGDHGSGAFEDVQDLARKNATAIGGILACLVRNKQMRFSDAESLAGEYGGELVQ